MALLAFPRSLSLLPFSLSCRRLRTNRSFCSLSAASSDGVAVLWFKHDLRVDDHPGLVAASNYRAVVPVYVFDHRILSRFSDEMIELVLVALKDLRKSLKEQGSDLMIRFGNAENVILKLVEEVKATNIFTEEEVEYSLRMMMDIVKGTLATASSLDPCPEVELWQTPFYDVKNLEDLPEFYENFKKLQVPVTSPLLPSTLPGADMELDWGQLPSFDDLKKFMITNSCKSREPWTSIKETSAETVLRKKSLKPGENYPNNSSLRQFEMERKENSVSVTRKGTFVGGGTNAVLNALAAFLRYLDGAAQDDWHEVHERLRNAETVDGASFGVLFGPALHLGIVSRRRVRYEAFKYEREQTAGFVSSFGSSAATTVAAADAVCSMEWYWLLALKGQTNNVRTCSTRIWRWKGYLIQYTVVGNEGPSILLVHGFGAFLEHYRDNLCGIAEGGNQVWAVTLLGFGKSEKPNLVYTEVMWAELLRDFIIEVVDEPVHLVGNSIGGYIVALVAGLWPSLVKSVVLVNSAGNIIPGYSSVSFSKARKASGAARLGGRLILFYLRLSIKNIVKNCYPTRSERADDWLVDEMLRASHDPGVLFVLESIFGFNLSIPLNFLLKGFEDKVLVIQGMKDPITNSTSKVAMLKEHCPGFVIKELDAGHCPHDEVPVKVNSIICEWIVTAEGKVRGENFL